MKFADLLGDVHRNTSGDFGGLRRGKDVARFVADTLGNISRFHEAEIAGLTVHSIFLVALAVGVPITGARFPLLERAQSR